MDGCIDRTQLNNLGAGGSDKTAIRRAAGGGELCIASGFILDRGHHGVDQIATRCQERLTAEGPGEVVVQSMFIKDCLSTLAQVGIGHYSGEAEVKYHLNTAGNHIGRAGTAIDVRYLNAGRGEEFVSVIPVLSRQIGK